MFSPFEKPLKDLAAADLEQLRSVAEGWYVEYKSEMSKAPDVAKSVSALANTYGGWVFYGVEEKSKTDAVAGAFPGIAVADADAGLQRIRQAVAQLMNPATHFDARAIVGDGKVFASDRVVICVRVPQSLAAPHVHSSGRIYRRVADGSEPKAENDRHLLDQLFRRSNELRQQFAEWVDLDPELSRGEEDIPYLRLMMIADPWSDESPWLETNAAELKPLFAQNPGVVSSVPFDTIYTSSRGYVARQSGNDPHNLGLTWRFRESLVSDVYVPLSLYAVNAPTILREHLEGYEQADRFVELLEAKGYSSPRVVDLNLLFNVLVGVVEIQRRLLAKASWSKSYFVKARLLNVWRTVPFLDVDAVMDRFEADGLPVCLDGLVTAPSGTDPESFQEVQPMLDAQVEAARIMLQALVVLEPVAQAWGLPTVMDRALQPPMYERLQRAGTRGAEIQKRKAAERHAGDARS